MRRLFLPLIACSMLVPAHAQRTAISDSTGLAGDHFSLEGALELFKRNFEMERFEQELNTDSTHVNQLDLDRDGQVDFLRVVVLPREGDAVTIVIRALVGTNEQQDVAVVLVGKAGEDGALVQICGDEDLYPAGTFIEPLATDETVLKTTSAANVWSWRPVPWCFSPRFYTYVSPWNHKEKPQWWQAVPAGRSREEHAGPALVRYRQWDSCRLPQARAAYAPHRSRSATVGTRATTPAK